MTFITHLKKILADQIIILLILSLFCFLFEFLFAWLFFESDFKKTMASFILRMPPGLTAFLGVQGGITSFFIQMLAFGYTHPVILICLAFFPISIPARYISGEVELSTFDLLLTKPVNRLLVPLAIFTFLGLALTLLASAMVLGTLAGNLYFDLNVKMIDYAKASITGIFFFLSMGAVSIAIASFQSEKAKAAGKAISLMVLLYFFDTLVKLSTTLTHLSGYSYFQLYQPGKLVMKQADMSSSILISLTLTLVFLGTGLFRFCRRDL